MAVYRFASSFAIAVSPLFFINLCFSLPLHLPPPACQSNLLSPNNSGERKNALDLRKYSLSEKVNEWLKKSTRERGMTDDEGKTLTFHQSAMEKPTVRNHTSDRDCITRNEEFILQSASAFNLFFPTPYTSTPGDAHNEVFNTHGVQIWTIPFTSKLSFSL